MIYLDNAATTFPKPQVVSDAMALCIRNYCGNPGRSGHRLSIKTGEEIYKARSRVAKLISAENPSRIIFFQNTSMALNQGIKGLLLPGQHVVSTVMEHNSVLRPLQMMSYLGVDYQLAKPDHKGSFTKENILNLINDKTKLVIMTHAANTTGQLLPIDTVGKEIKKINQDRRKTYGDMAEEIIFLVDAAQSIGSVPINVREMNIDMLAAPGHKALFGPQGTAFLYVREGIELQPLLEGGTGTDSKKIEIFPEMPEAFEVGTLNSPGIVGLSYGIEFVEKIGIQKIHKYEQHLISSFEDALREIKNVKLYDNVINFTGEENKALGISDRTLLSQSEKTPVVLFNIKGKTCEEVASRLNDDFQIAVRAGYHCSPLAHQALGTYETGAVRLSASPFTTVKEMQTALDAIFKIAKSPS